MTGRTDGGGPRLTPRKRPGSAAAYGYPRGMTSPTPDPSEPIQVDLARVAGVGTVAWLIALVVCALLAVFDQISWTPAAVCGVGVILGVAGVWWSRGHDRMGRRLPR